MGIVSHPSKREGPTNDHKDVGEIATNSNKTKHRTVPAPVTNDKAQYCAADKPNPDRYAHTFTRHHYQTLFPDTRHFFQTPLPDAITRRDYQTPLPDTITRHHYQTPLPDTITRHHHQTPLPDTITRHQGCCL